MAPCSPAVEFRSLAEEASLGLSAGSARLSRIADRKRRPNRPRSWIWFQEDPFQQRQPSFSKPGRSQTQGFGNGPPGSFATETACSPGGKAERCGTGGRASARSRAARPGAMQGASRPRHPRRGQLPQNPEELESANVRRDCGKLSTESDLTPTMPRTWSGRRGSNPRHSAWEADVLPLNYSRASTSIHQMSSACRSRIVLC